jgi:hypothetical protein
LDSEEVARAAVEISSATRRLRTAVRALDDPAASVVVASLSRGSLHAVRAILEGFAPAADGDAEAALRSWLAARGVAVAAPAAGALAAAGCDVTTMELLADDLDADAMGRLLGWTLVRLEVSSLLSELAGQADRLLGAAGPG